MKKNNFKKGFTLLETIVALGILATGITGMFVLLQDIETNFGFAKSYITAAYLNQEAVELLRNIKDSNVFESTDLYDKNIFLSGEFGPLYFEVDPMQADFISQLVILNDSSIQTNCFSGADKYVDCYKSLRDIKMRDDFPYYYYPLGNDTNPNANIKRVVRVEKLISESDGTDDYETIKIESRTFFKIKDKIYVHKVIHYMYDR